MNKHEFESLRDLPGKVISQDIKFTLRSETSPNWVFDNIPLQNALGWEIVLNGTFKPHIPSVTFNFYQRGVGPICRLDVNGTCHKDVGRTHKHALRDEQDQKRNLPTAVARPELNDQSVRAVWETLCQDARIDHQGKFYSPDEEVA